MEIGRKKGGATRKPAKAGSSVARQRRRGKRKCSEEEPVESSEDAESNTARSEDRKVERWSRKPRMNREGRSEPAVADSGAARREEAETWRATKNEFKFQMKFEKKREARASLSTLFSPRGFALLNNLSRGKSSTTEPEGPRRVFPKPCTRHSFAARPSLDLGVLSASAPLPSFQSDTCKSLLGLGVCHTSSPPSPRLDPSVVDPLRSPGVSTLKILSTLYLMRQVLLVDRFPILLSMEIRFAQSKFAVESGLHPSLQLLPLVCRTIWMLRNPGLAQGLWFALGSLVRLGPPSLWV